MCVFTIDAYKSSKVLPVNTRCIPYKDLILLLDYIHFSVERRHLCAEKSPTLHGKKYELC